ncbi:hypothetical protein WME75_23010 [Sorangium sp. So ce1014]|uniref:hypothetical protein n=1 Tax=Sorangium sp. So ce1014 TaxID=3133326 RepID=UPI003F611858
MDGLRTWDRARSLARDRSRSARSRDRAWIARGATEGLLELVDEGFRALAREHERP